MIQRVQSIYFFLGAIFISLLAFFPVFSLSYDGITYTLSGAGGMVNQAEEQLFWPFYFLPLVVSSAIIALVNIFQYRNLKKQLSWGKMILWINGLAVAAMFAFVLQGIMYLGDDAVFGYEIVALAPALSFVFFYLAYKGVKADYDLIKSTDRIR